MRPDRPDGASPEMAAHSGWMLLFALCAAVAILCAVFLLYYVALPSNVPVGEHVSPSTLSTPVHLRIADMFLDIPANYLPYASERTGGSRGEIVLYAELPDFRGYSARHAAAFGEYELNSAILHILLKREDFDISEALRLNRIYLKAVADQRGQKGRFGLISYTFRNNSGYRGEDLFVGSVGNGIVVMRCTRPGAGLPSANCLREIQLTPNVSLSYRFARSQLARWYQIADGVSRLMARFRRR